MRNFNNLKNHWSKLPNREEILRRISETIKNQYKNGRKTWCEGKKLTNKQKSKMNMEGLKKGWGWSKGKKFTNTIGYGNWKDGRSLNKKSYNKYFYYKNIEKSRNKSRIYMHNRKTQGIRLTREILQRVYEDNIKQYGTLTCYLCLKQIKFGKDSLEHKIPISRGGTNFYSNLDIAHIKCNISKANKTVKEYEKYISNLK